MHRVPQNKNQRTAEAVRFAISFVFLSLVKSTELMSAVSGTDRITPMLLDMPLTTSIARYDELSS